MKYYSLRSAMSAVICITTSKDLKTISLCMFLKLMNSNKFRYKQNKHSVLVQTQENRKTRFTTNIPHELPHENKMRKRHLTDRSMSDCLVLQRLTPDVLATLEVTQALPYGGCVFGLLVITIFSVGYHQCSH